MVREKMDGQRRSPPSTGTRRMDEFRCRKEIGERRWPWSRIPVTIVCEARFDGDGEWTSLCRYTVD